MNRALKVGMEHNSFVLWNCPKPVLYPAIANLTLTWALPVLTLWVDVWTIVQLWFWLYLVIGGVVWLVVVPLVTIAKMSKSRGKK